MLEDNVGGRSGSGTVHALAGCGGQNHGEDGSRAAGQSGSSHLHEATVLFHDSLTDPKAEAIASRSFAGDEGLEQAAFGLRRDTGTIISDQDTAHAETAPPQADLEASTVIDGFNGIADEVGEHLADFGSGTVGDAPGGEIARQ